MQVAVESNHEGLYGSELDRYDKPGVLINLDRKDDPNAFWYDESSSYSITRFNRYPFFGKLESLTRLQNSVIHTVSDAINEEWGFRQARVYRGEAIVESELTGGNDRFPFVLVYQRKGETEFAEDLYQLGELEKLAQKINCTSSELNAQGNPRYTFKKLGVDYDWRADLGRPGAGAGDARLLIVELFVKDHTQALSYVARKLKKAEGKVESLQHEKRKLEGILSATDF